MIKGYYTTVEYNGVTFLVYMNDGMLTDVTLADVFHASNKNLIRCLNSETIKHLTIMAVKNEISGEVEYD
jgi:hypothetical protein